MVWQSMPQWTPLHSFHWKGKPQNIGKYFYACYYGFKTTNQSDNVHLIGRFKNVTIGDAILQYYQRLCSPQKGCMRSIWYWFLAFSQKKLTASTIRGDQQSDQSVNWKCIYFECVAILTHDSIQYAHSIYASSTAGSKTPSFIDKIKLYIHRNNAWTTPFRIRCFIVHFGEPEPIRCLSDICKKKN